MLYAIYATHSEPNSAREVEYLSCGSGLKTTWLFQMVVLPTLEDGGFPDLESAIASVESFPHLTPPRWSERVSEDYEWAEEHLRTCSVCNHDLVLMLRRVKVLSDCGTTVFGMPAELMPALTVGEVLQLGETPEGYSEVARRLHPHIQKGDVEL